MSRSYFTEFPAKFITTKQWIFMTNLIKTFSLSNQDFFYLQFHVTESTVYRNASVNNYLLIVTYLETR